MVSDTVCYRYYCKQNQQDLENKQSTAGRNGVITKNKQ